MSLYPAIGITYWPKIPALRSGECKQNIQKMNLAKPRKAGEKVLLYDWDRMPHCSPWTLRQVVTIAQVIDLHVYDASGDWGLLRPGRGWFPIQEEDVRLLLKDEGFMDDPAEFFPVGMYQVLRWGRSWDYDFDPLTAWEKWRAAA